MAEIIGYTSSNKWTFKLVANETIPSDYIATNKTHVTVTLQIGRALGAGNSWCQGRVSYTINNISGSVQITWGSSSSHQATPGSWHDIITVDLGDVTHSDDGTYNLYLDCSCSTNFTPSTMGAQGWFTLTTIPRKSEIASWNVPLMTSWTTTTTISAKSSSFNNILKYRLPNGQTGTIGSRYGSGNITGTIPHSVFNSYPYNYTIDCQLYLETYNGGTLVGTDSLNWGDTYIELDSNQVPTISTASAAEGNPIVSVKYEAPTSWPNTLHIQGISYPSVSGTFNGIYGSSISEYIFCYRDAQDYVISQISATSLSDLNSKLSKFDNNTQYSYALQVKDSRGRYSDLYPVTFTLSPYSAPEIFEYQSDRSLNDRTFDDEGPYLNCQFSGAVSSLNNLNTMTVTIGLKKTGDLDYNWTQCQVTAPSFNLTGNNSVLIQGPADWGDREIKPDETYMVLFKVEDAFNATYRFIDIPTAFTLIDWAEDGTGMAIGRRNTESNKFQIGLPTSIDNSLSINSNLFAWHLPEQYWTTAIDPFVDIGGQYNYLIDASYIHTKVYDITGYDTTLNKFVLTQDVIDTSNFVYENDIISYDSTDGKIHFNFTDHSTAIIKVDITYTNPSSTDTYTQIRLRLETPLADNIVAMASCRAFSNGYSTTSFSKVLQVYTGDSIYLNKVSSAMPGPATGSNYVSTVTITVLRFI